MIISVKCVIFYLIFVSKLNLKRVKTKEARTIFLILIYSKLLDSIVCAQLEIFNYSNQFNIIPVNGSFNS